MKDKMASDHLKSKKTDPGNLWNRFLFCNTFFTACTIFASYGMFHSDAQRQHRKDGYL